MLKHILYKSGYKYQLAQNYGVRLPAIFCDGHKHVLPVNADIKYIVLTSDGFLSIQAGYAWDGASGPVKDSKINMRASLIHDALYQLMREGILSQDRHKAPSDRFFRDMCIKDGVSRWRAYVWYFGLYNFGHVASSPDSRKLTLRAP